MAGEDARVGAAMEAAVDAVTELVRLSEGFGRALEQHVATVATESAPGASGRLPGPPGAAVPLPGPPQQPAGPSSAATVVALARRVLSRSLPPGADRNAATLTTLKVIWNSCMRYYLSNDIDYSVISSATVLGNLANPAQAVLCFMWSFQDMTQAGVSDEDAVDSLYSFSGDVLEANNIILIPPNVPLVRGLVPPGTRSDFEDVLRCTINTMRCNMMDHSIADIPRIARIFGLSRVIFKSSMLTTEVINLAENIWTEAGRPDVVGFLALWEHLNTVVFEDNMDIFTQIGLVCAIFQSFCRWLGVAIPKMVPLNQGPPGSSLAAWTNTMVDNFERKFWELAVQPGADVSDREIVFVPERNDWLQRHRHNVVVVQHEPRPASESTRAPGAEEEDAHSDIDEMVETQSKIQQIIARLPTTMTDQEKQDWAEFMATVEDPFIDDMELSIAALDLNKMD
jgi:hypothetical protein